MNPLTANLSEWAINNRALVTFMMIVTIVAGIWSYQHLGRSEDPPFTFKAMIVQAQWPGASMEDTIQQVTDRIERKLQEVPNIDSLKSYTIPGQTTIMVVLKDSTNPKLVPDAWYQVRKKMDDIQHTLPRGTQGPFFNDEFGDTFGNIYALTWDGYTYAEAKDFAESALAGVGNELRFEASRIKEGARGTVRGHRDVSAVHPRVQSTLSNDKPAITEMVGVRPGGSFDQYRQCA